MGHVADCFPLVRTDPEAAKHKGISFLLVDMKTPGITVAWQITGGPVGEVFSIPHSPNLGAGHRRGRGLHTLSYDAISSPTSAISANGGAG
jgi:alkylation response protein AidB-like acyl-CoA dehydrogenase